MHVYTQDIQVQLIVFGKVEIIKKEAKKRYDFDHVGRYLACCMQQAKSAAAQKRLLSDTLLTQKSRNMYFIYGYLYIMYGLCYSDVWCTCKNTCMLLGSDFKQKTPRSAPITLAAFLGLLKSALWLALLAHLPKRVFNRDSSTDTCLSYVLGRKKNSRHIFQLAKKFSLIYYVFKTLRTKTSQR